MPLRLVTGPANSAKAGAVLGAYRAALGREPLLVVPTGDDVAHYERELAAGGPLIGGQVTSFAGLVREIARRAGVAERPLGDVARRRLLRGAIARSELELLAPSAAGAGFTAAAERLLAELAAALATPARFAQALERWAGEDEWRRRYARELAAIDRNYCAALERRGATDRERHLLAACDALRAQPRRWGATPVFLYGFDDLAPLQREVIETLARHAEGEVTVSLNFESGRVAFAGRATTFQELQALGAEVVALEPQDDHYAPSARTALHHLERSLFEDSATEPVPAGAAVRLLEGGGERAEAELVAAEIAALLAAGWQGEEIAVLARDVAARGPLLARVLAELGVPATLRVPVPIARTSLGRALLAMLRVAADPQHATADDVLVWLRAPGRLARPELADRLELELRQRGLSGAADARALWQEQNEYGLGRLDVLERACARGGDALIEGLRDAARRLLAEGCGARGAVLDGPERQDAAALVAVLRALDELEQVERVSAREVLEELAAVTCPPEPPAPGAVLIADPLAVRARRFRAVFACGLEDGVFPRGASPDPFFADEQRAELAKASGLRLGLRPDALAEERYLFYATVSRATELLVLARRSADDAGTPLRPSPFIAAATGLFEPGTIARRARSLGAVTWDPREAPSATERERAAAERALPKLPEPAIASLGERAVGRLRQRERLSAGALETYARCPVRWFAERELELEELAPTAEPLTRGNIAHDVLEKVLRGLGEPLRIATLARARELLAVQLADLSAQGRVPAGAAGAALRTRLHADLERLLAHEADSAGEFAAAEFERSFGMDDDPDALGPLVLDDGRLELRGRIDRIDIDSAGRAVVRDYKSGKVRPDFAVGAWEREDTLQIGLYALAVRELLAREVVACLYQPLGAGDLRARGAVREDAALEGVVDRDRVSEEDFDAALERVRSRAIELARRLRAGDLEPCPDTCTTRRDGGCAYPGICRSAA